MVGIRERVVGAGRSGGILKYFERIRCGVRKRVGSRMTWFWLEMEKVGGRDLG